MFRIIQDPSSGVHLHILTKVLQIHGASPYSRHGGCIGEPIVCTVCCVEEDCREVLFYTADCTHNMFPYAATMPTIWTRSMNL